jgi:proline dehydrogenase
MRPRGERPVAGLVPALPRPLVRRLAEPYLAGPALADALACVRRLHGRGRAAAVALLGEGLTRRADVERMVRRHEEALAALAEEEPDVTLSLTPSALGLAVDPETCVRNLRRLGAAAGERGIALTLDMESADTVDATIAIFRELRADGLDGIGLTIQARLRRARSDLRPLTALRPRVRLCKGAWPEPRSVAWSDRDTIRAAYARLLVELIGTGCAVEVASHDEWVHWRALELVSRQGVRRDRYEFGLYLGVADDLADALVAANHRVRVHVPYGEDVHAFALRRLRENPQLARQVAGDALGRARRR